MVPLLLDGASTVGAAAGARFRLRCEGPCEVTTDDLQPLSAALSSLLSTAMVTAMVPGRHIP
eukprot:scaffold66739_cov32-Tisochrysis_lutea.AAC.10